MVGRHLILGQGPHHPSFMRRPIAAIYHRRVPRTPMDERGTQRACSDSFLPTRTRCQQQRTHGLATTRFDPSW